MKNTNTNAQLWTKKGFTGKKTGNVEKKKWGAGLRSSAGGGEKSSGNSGNGVDGESGNGDDEKDEIVVEKKLNDLKDEHVVLQSFDWKYL